MATKNELTEGIATISGRPIADERMIAAALASVCAVFGPYGGFTDAMLQGWLMAFRNAKDVPTADLVDAFGRWLETQGAMPKPADILADARSRSEFRISERTLMECARQSAIEGAEKLRAFGRRMIDQYGRDDRETVAKHIAGIQGQLQVSGLKSLPVPSEVLEGLEDARRRMEEAGVSAK